MQRFRHHKKRSFLDNGYTDRVNHRIECKQKTEDIIGHITDSCTCQYCSTWNSHEEACKRLEEQGMF